MTDTGGPAFPQDELDDIGEQTILHPGLTMLDWFAGQALISFTGATLSFAEKDTATKAYELAAAMVDEKRRREAQT